MSRDRKPVLMPKRFTWKDWLLMLLLGGLIWLIREISRP